LTCRLCPDGIHGKEEATSRLQKSGSRIRAVANAVFEPVPDLVDRNAFLGCGPGI
jgi:hypothetical protein